MWCSRVCCVAYIQQCVTKEIIISIDCVFPCRVDYILRFALTDWHTLLLENDSLLTIITTRAQITVEHQNCSNKPWDLVIRGGEWTTRTLIYILSFDQNLGLNRFKPYLVCLGTSCGGYHLSVPANKTHFYLITDIKPHKFYLLFPD